MTTSLNSLAKALKALHQPGSPAIMTNIYDALSAKVVASLPSVKALATASYAVAAAAGLSDDDLTLELNLTAAKHIAHAIRDFGKPLSVDFRDGYGQQLEYGVRQLVTAGVAGINLEDYDSSFGRMYSPADAASRIRMVLDVAQTLGVPEFVLNARCDVLLHGGTLQDVIERGERYLAAGATTVFVWGGSRGVSRDEVKELVEAFDGKLNVLLKSSPDGLRPKELAELGVARISMGPFLQSKAMNALRDEAERILAE